MYDPEKNKLRCKLYFQKMKGNLSKETLDKRREQNKINQKIYYERNKELCIQRSRDCRAKKKFLNPNYKTKKSISFIEFNRQKINDERVSELKEICFSEYLKKYPTLRLWDKKLIDWTNRDYSRFKKMIL